MTDRELLEAAAKAAGIDWADGHESTGLRDQNGRVWNPLTDDGDAFRLAVKCGIDLELWGAFDSPWFQPDPYAATRRAIVRAAAEIGKGLK